MGDSSTKKHSSSRKHSSTDVGGPAGFSARTPPQQNSPTIPSPPEDLVINDDVFPPPDDDGFTLNFSIFDALFMLSGMGTYVADVVTDIIVAAQYLVSRDYSWAAMTFVFVLITSVTLQYFSLRWFIIDKNEEQWHEGKGFIAKVLSWAEWLLFHIFQLGAIKRYWRTLKYGWRSRNKSDQVELRKRNYRMMVYEYRDITMLRLLEAFMESAPQLVLQLYIMKKQDDANEEIHWITGISALVSLSSLAWGLEAYHKALRESRLDKKNINYIAVGFRMMWRSFTITSRVISMALFASLYKWIIFPIVGVHWLLMTIWLVIQKTDFCSTQVEELFFDAVIGIVYIFSFFNMKEGHTRYRAAFFYIIVFIENTVMFALWYHYDGKPYMKWYTIPALVFVWGGFVMGLFFMLSYYCCLHPNIDYPCFTDDDKGSDERQTQSWDNRGMDEVDRSVRKDRFEGNLFTRIGRRNLHAYGDSLYESVKSEQQSVKFEPPLQNQNHSNSIVTQPTSFVSNGRKQWTESRV